MLLKNRYFNSCRSFLAVVLFPLLVLAAAYTFSNHSSNFVTTTTATQYGIVHPLTLSHFFIGCSKDLSGTSDEFICEEKNDDETKEDHITKSSFSCDLLIHLLKPTAALSSKEFAYYNANGKYKTPLSLYTLFCSWKSFLN